MVIRPGYVLSIGVGVALLGCGSILGIDDVGYGSGGDSRESRIGSDAPVYPYDTGGGPDTLLADAANGGPDTLLADAANDTLSSSCPCPPGTTGSLGDCTLARPMSNGACGFPLAVPLCTMALHFQLCPTDPTFPFVNGTAMGACAFDGGSDSRVAAFFKLASHTASYHVVLNGSAGELFSIPNASCTASDPIVCVDVPASITQPIDGPLDNAEIAVGKGSSSACDPITMTITPL